MCFLFIGDDRRACVLRRPRDKRDGGGDPFIGRACVHDADARLAHRQLHDAERGKNGDVGGPQFLSRAAQRFSGRGIRRRGQDAVARRDGHGDLSAPFVKRHGIERCDRIDIFRKFIARIDTHRGLRQRRGRV